MSKDSSLPKKPFRDSALLYAGLAVLFVLVAWITGAAILPRNWGDSDQRVIGALPVALGCFLIATGYAWWRLKRRLERESASR
jgi:hypothetical protein